MNKYAHNFVVSIRKSWSGLSFPLLLFVPHQQPHNRFTGP